MTDTLFPFVKLRRAADGAIRPRFEPGPRERALGFAAEDLKHADGRWYNLDEAHGFAVARLDEIKAARISGKRNTSPAAARTGTTVSDLLDGYFKSGAFDRLRPRTKLDYEKKARAIRYRPRSPAERSARVPLQPETIALAPARTLTPATVKDFFEYLASARGLAMARGAIMVLSAAYKWARLSQAWQIDVNPCTRLDLPPLRTDVVIFEPHEVNALCRMGDATGDEAIVDAAVLSLCTDQRPSDVFAFTGGSIAAGVIRLIQSKTGARVEIPAMQMLRDRLAAMQGRRQRLAITAAELVVDDRTRRAFTERAFNGRWRDLIARTAAGDAGLGLEPCPSIAGKKFKYLRKTTFTWLKRAGNDFEAVASVSGHTIETVPKMAKHYLAEDPDTARQAIDLLEAYMTRIGVKG